MAEQAIAAHLDAAQADVLARVQAMTTVSSTRRDGQSSLAISRHLHQRHGQTDIL
ncbi:MAG: hypothetical protein ACRDJN_03535 [Chloroflexota bacterium]